MVAIKLFFICLLFSTSVFSENLAEYNKALMSYENKIKSCKDTKQKEFTDQFDLNIDDSAIRTGLSYFILKNDIECSKKEQTILINAVNTIQHDLSIAEMIRFDSRNILELFKDSDRMLSEEKQKFMALDSETKIKLKKIEAYKRPFDPMMALNHYLNEK